MNADDQAITIAIIALARSLNLEVTGEGVETAEQQRFLMESNCQQVQGYFCGRPLPAEQFTNLLKNPRLLLNAN